MGFINEFFQGLKDGFCFYGWGYITGSYIFALSIILLSSIILKIVEYIIRGKNV